MTPNVFGDDWDAGAHRDAGPRMGEIDAAARLDTTATVLRVTFLLG